MAFVHNGFIEIPQEGGDDFISEDAFQEKVQDQYQEALKWKDLPTGVIYKILEVAEVEGKFGKSKILTLKNREGETTKVWACPTLNKEKGPLQGAFVRSTGFKLSKKSNQQYLSYDARTHRNKFSDASEKYRI